MKNNLRLNRKIKPILLTVSGLALLAIIIVAGIQISSKEQVLEIPPQLTPKEDSIPAISDEITPPTESEVTNEPLPDSAAITTEEEPPQPTKEPVVPKFAPPATFGFVESADLPEIGVRALFPENTNVNYYDYEDKYYIDLPEKWTALYFTIYDYAGGGRRTWFRKNIGRPGSIYENFGSGYITYFKDTDGGLYDLYYFAVVRSDKMLVVKYEAEINNSALEKFRSFVSTISIIDVKEDEAEVETKRSSDTRKTIWEEVDYGLRVIAPEWIEERYITNRNEDGPVEYSEWKKTYPEVSFYEGEHGYGEGEGKSIYVKGFYSAGGAAIYLLSSEYTGKTFTDVINDILPGAGYCMDEWDDPVSECKGRPYCYAKNEVIENLILRKTAQFGPYTAQLRGINTAFSVENDCRGSDIWLIQAKGGQYALTLMNPDGKDFKLEGF